MDVVAYEFKRAHWSMYSTAKREFERVAADEVALRWMTPARYDILHAIAEHMWWTRKPGPRSCPDAEMPMRDLVTQLGLHSSTVSKVVKRMKKLELVTTTRAAYDGRKVIIKMTQDGWDALRAARRMFRERPQHFMRARHGAWLRSLGMRDSIGSMRTAQRWAKSLASTFGLDSHPIHDPRCDLGWREHTWIFHVFDFARRRFVPPPPNVRRRAYS